MEVMIQDFLAIKQAGQEFKDYGISKSWFYKQRAKGRLRFSKPVGVVCVRRSDLERLILTSLKVSDTPFPDFDTLNQ